MSRCQNVWFCVVLYVYVCYIGVISSTKVTPMAQEARLLNQERYKEQQPIGEPQ